jgi:hypothetical protein
MTASDDSGELQFDEVAPRAGEATAAAAPGHACTVCHAPFDLEYFDVNGQHICGACSQKVAYLADTPRGIGALGRAAAAGIVAAILGAALYYAVLAITGFEVGLVAIAIGYMVGYGIRLGTRGRGGRRFQALALALTYWAVGLAYSSLALQQMVQERSGTRTSASAAQTSGAPAAAAQGEEPSPAAGGGLALGLLVLLGFTFVLPVIVVAGSLPGGLLSGAIIVFGMLQAWRMTAAPVLTVSGPYRIGATPAAAG